MATLVLPRIGSTVEARERKIQADLDAAQQANDAACTTAAAQDKALAEARGRAEAVIRAASMQLPAETSAQMHAVGSPKKKRLAADITAAERRIGEQQNQAMTGFDFGMAAEIASAILRQAGRLGGRCAGRPCRRRSGQGR